MEHLIIVTAVRFQVRREVSFCRMVEGGLGFDAVPICRQLHGKNRRGLELKRTQLGSIPLFPGAGCSGLNNPDSGAGAGK